MTGLNKSISKKFFKPVPYFLNYSIPAVIVVVAWYGWTYEYFPYDGDLINIGPLAKFAFIVTGPIKKLTLFINPTTCYFCADQSLTTTLLFTWLMWFILLRIVFGFWNYLSRKLGESTV